MPPIPLMKGTLDLLVLKALSWTPRHGLEITAWLEERSGGELTFDDSGVYQALYRMEERGLIEAEWQDTPKGRRAKVYSLTAAGRRQLAEHRALWERFSGALGAILETT